MNRFQDLKQKFERGDALIGVLGLGYVGLPLCHALHEGGLRVIHLAFDVVEAARARFERLIARATPLSRDDRTELETVIDAMGPRVAIWLPARIPVRETMAIAQGIVADHGGRIEMQSHVGKGSIFRVVLPA